MHYRLVCVTLSLLGLAGIASSEVVDRLEFEVVATIGVEPDDILIPQPSVIGFRDDRSVFYVYSASTCEVYVLDAGLREVGRFGRCGEGPGDLSDVLLIEDRDQEIHVVMAYRISRYSLDGEYIGDVSLAERPINAPVIALGASYLAAAYPRYDRIVSWEPCSVADSKIVLDAHDDEVLEFFGRQDDAVYFYGSRGGAIHRVNVGDFRTERLSIGVESADVERRTSGSGQASYWQSPIVAAWMDAQGAYVATLEDNAPRWKDLAKLAEAGGPDYVVREYDSAFQNFRSLEFRPRGWPLNDVVAVGDGELLLVDRWGSRVARVRRR